MGRGRRWARRTRRTLVACCGRLLRLPRQGFVFFSDGQDLTDMEPQNPAGRGAGQAKAKPGGRGAGRQAGGHTTHQKPKSQRKNALVAPQVEIFRGGAGRRPIWGSERGPGSKMAKIGPLWDREISSRGEFWYMRSSGVKSRACAPLKPTAREAGRQSSTIQNPRQGGQAGSRSPISRRDNPALRGGNETQ